MKKSIIKNKLSSLALTVLLIVAVMFNSVGVKADETAALSDWTEGAVAKEALVNYMATITDENSPDYIPVQDRIAVFDLDGTLYCETDPIYFDHMLCCDDTERENGNISKAEKMYSLCEEQDWIPISMKNDWLTIYGEGVQKK